MGARQFPIRFLSAFKEAPSLRWAWPLEQALQHSLANVPQLPGRTLVLVDVSGSMTQGECAGVPGLSPRVGSAAMALVTAAVERRHAFVAFTSGHPGEWVRGAGLSQHSAYGYRAAISELDISPRQRLGDVCKQVAALPMGGTDCALPMLWAMERKVEVDAFCVYTDSETWHGDVHPTQALKNG